MRAEAFGWALPLVANHIFLPTIGRAPPKAYARNEVAAPRVVGTSCFSLSTVYTLLSAYDIHFSNRITPIGAAFECADTSVRA